MQLRKQEEAAFRRVGYTGWVSREQIKRVDVCKGVGMRKIILPMHISLDDLTAGLR